jgi:DHA1 family bicyclomycin/chloramphenicol resistance-like MFS transporter
MVGSLLVTWLPWQSVFWFMAAFGSGCLVLILTLLEETNPPARRSGGLAAAFRSYGTLITDRHFVGTVLIGGFSQAALFAYLAGSPFVYITLNRVAPTTYSALFAINAVGLIGMAQLNVWLMRRLGASRLVFIGALTQSLFAAALLIVTLLDLDRVPVIAVLLFFTVSCQGVLGPTTAMLSLERYAASAGAASALMGTLQFACGAISSTLVSVFFNGTAVPLAAVIAGCAFAGLILACTVGRTDAPADHARAAAVPAS